MKAAAHTIALGLASVLAATAAATSTSAAANVTSSPYHGARLETCKEAKPDGMCGTVAVPLDRNDPSKGTIDIFFEYFPHRDPGPATSAIIATGGGPGGSVTQDEFLRSFYPQELFRPLMDARDLILLDQRGVGRSSAIDCPKLQRAEGPIREAVAECGGQLGDTANLYASDNVALDIDAVRAALGIDLLDFYGESYAAQDLQAYAARFPQHLRSAILDSPVTTIGWEPFDPLTRTAWLHASNLVCKRSRSCAAEHGDNTRAIAWLARRLRGDPVKGSARDATGRRHHVRITEGFLVWSILPNDGSFTYIPSSEIGAAARSLRRGDEKPLLRLAAETEGPLYGDEGNPRGFSNGLSFARSCTDTPMPWDKSAPRDQRLAQYEALRAALPDDAFAPFSVDAWLAPVPVGPIGPDLCLDWPAPDPRVPTPIPPGAELPGGVPALILAGDIDLGTPFAWARLINQAWPNSRLIKIANAPHHTAIGYRSECVGPLIVEFIRTLEARKTGCASKVQARVPAVGRFPATAGQAHQARSAHDDRSTALDRKIATVATAAVTDALRRNFLVGDASVTPGLRGGTAEIGLNEAGDGLVAKLDKARFAGNVSVSGRAGYGFESELIDANVHVHGPKGEYGRLRIDGLWFSFFHDATSFAVHGRLGGHRIRVRVPAG